MVNVALLRFMAGTLPRALGPLPRLTGRELDVLLLLCSPECLLEKQIWDRLKMSQSTFKTRREHLFLIFNVHSRLELISKAVQWGLVVCYCGGLGAHADDAPPTSGELGCDPPPSSDPQLPFDRI